MLLAAPFLQAALAVLALAQFRPVRCVMRRLGLRYSVLALVAVAATFELLRTVLHG